MDQFAVYLQHDAKDETLQAYGEKVIPAIAERSRSPEHPLCSANDDPQDPRGARREDEPLNAADAIDDAVEEATAEVLHADAVDKAEAAAELRTAADELEAEAIVEEAAAETLAEAAVEDMVAAEALAEAADDEKTPEGERSAADRRGSSAHLPIGWSSMIAGIPFRTLPGLHRTVDDPHVRRVRRARPRRRRRLPAVRARERDLDADLPRLAWW